MSRPIKSIEERLAGRWMVDTKTGCWEWLGAKTGAGYGAIRTGTTGAKMLGAHRATYELHVGLIPEGMEIDHLCRNRGCVNPAHLEPVTPQVNTARAKAVITHCPRGHEYTPENTMISRGGRNCRICKRAAWRRWKYGAAG